MKAQPIILSLGLVAILVTIIFVFQWSPNRVETVKVINPVGETVITIQFMPDIGTIITGEYVTMRDNGQITAFIDDCIIYILPNGEVVINLLNDGWKVERKF